MEMTHFRPAIGNDFPFALTIDSPWLRLGLFWGDQVLLAEVGLIVHRRYGQSEFCV
jgi:hypothetical protein